MDWLRRTWIQFLKKVLPVDDNQFFLNKKQYSYKFPFPLFIYMGEILLLLRPASEISLKSYFVKTFFLKKLLNSIKTTAKQNNLEIKILKRTPGMILIQSPDTKKAVELLKRIFGIASFSLAEKTAARNMEEVKALVLAYAKEELRKGDSFALRVNRLGEHEFTSQEIAVECGNEIMNKMNGLRVDLKNPKKELFIELNKEQLFLYSGKFSGAKGLPLGVEGKVGVIMNGERNELIASWLMMKRGCNIFPVIKKMNKKIKENLEILKKWNSFREFKPIHFNELKNHKDFIEAIVLSKEKVNEQNLQEITSLSKKTPFPLFVPLMLYPKELLVEQLKQIKE